MKLFLLTLLFQMVFFSHLIPPYDNKSSKIQLCKNMIEYAEKYNQDTLNYLNKKPALKQTDLSKYNGEIEKIKKTNDLSANWLI